jgi:hypothetical protein
LEGFWRWCMLYRIHRNFLDFFHCPVFQKTRRFGNWICIRPQVKVGEKTPTLLGPLERANLNTWVGADSPTFTWGRKQIQFPNRRVFWNTGWWKKSRKILWILYSQVVIINFIYDIQLRTMKC